MERRVRGNLHARCEAGENSETVSKSYLSLFFLFSKMNNVAGISNAASQRASDLKLKCEYLQELHGSDRGVVFATGTPISNSMTEMYTMQTYLQPSVLRDLGITFFDGWAADFGETVTAMELSPSGQGYRARTRFAKFTNLPELLKLYRSFADVQTADMVKLNVPEAERHVINLKPSDTIIELAEEIADRADRIYGGGVDSHIDNMLKVTSDGKKLALDPRCFVPTSEDGEGASSTPARRTFSRYGKIRKVSKARRSCSAIYPRRRCGSRIIPTARTSTHTTTSNINSCKRAYLRRRLLSSMKRIQTSRSRLCLIRSMRARCGCLSAARKSAARERTYKSGS